MFTCNIDIALSLRKQSKRNPLQEQTLYSSPLLYTLLIVYLHFSLFEMMFAFVIM